MRATIGAVLVGAMSCSGTAYVARPPPMVSTEITERGETIYQGTTYRLGRPASEPALFTYERRVEQRSSDLVSTHVTRNPEGVLAVAESAVHSPEYLLQSYSLHADQQGHTGGIEVAEDGVHFHLEQDGKAQTAVEARGDPVVVGPTLVGFVVTRMEPLKSGKTIPVRFAVLDRLETLGFELSVVPGSDGQTRVAMKASSPLIALVVDPVFFTFDSTTSQLVRIEGRVPPKVLEDGRWNDLDARVEYRFVADHYR